MSRLTAVLLCVLVLSAARLTQAAGTQPFIVFDSMFQSGLPDLSSRGMRKMPGSGNVWRKGVSDRDVDPEGVRQATRYLRSLSDHYFFDIENWVLLDSRDEQIRADVAKFLSVADIARGAVPDGKFGFYDVAPKRTYWAILLKDRPDLLRAWRHMNDLSAPIAAKADFVLPSLYTFYDDPDGWETAAIAVLQDAHRFGKPVYPVLTFEFHNSNKELAGKQIPREFWRRELEVTRKYADGVVIWGGYKERWDEHAGWWLETEDFLQTLPKRPGSPTNPRVQH